MREVQSVHEVPGAFVRREQGRGLRAQVRFVAAGRVEERASLRGRAVDGLFEDARQAFGVRPRHALFSARAVSRSRRSAIATSLCPPTLTPRRSAR